METPIPNHYPGVEKCVEDVLTRVGNKIIFAMPLGLGKPSQLANELYRRAKNDSRIDLTIMTALSLELPGWKSELERRYLEPFIKRVFGDYVVCDYLADLRKNKLPGNVQAVELFFKPGAYLKNSHAQRNYISSNYSHIYRDVSNYGVNVIGQIVSKQMIDGRTQYSLSCNPDTVLDTVPAVRRLQGKKMMAIGQVNTNLPFMYGDAVVAPEFFDTIIENPAYNNHLFGAPKTAISDADYLIGLQVSALIKDGGTLQIGIGALGDAIVYSLQTRQQDNALYQKMLTDLQIIDKFGDAITQIGDTASFDQGLTGSTEMLVEGYLELIRCGVLKRKTYNNVHIQRLINSGKIGHEVTEKTVEALLECGAIQRQLTRKDFDFLCKFGIFKSGLSYDGESLRNGNTTFGLDLGDRQNLSAIVAECLGSRLLHPYILHAGFFLGPNALYDELREMSEEDRQLINMTSVLNVNELYSDCYSSQELKTLQRQKGRFVNTALMCTINGAIVSDGLDNGLVVSGVGGQYNFVAQAHALPDARGIIMVRSFRAKNAKVTSNIVWNYGHITIPRHLRDIVVTEYGIADLRGRSDQQIIASLLNITDSRFQETLLQQAKNQGKIAKDYRIPDQFRNNLPQRIEDQIKPFKAQGLFKPFPFGSDFTKEELVLGKAFKHLQAKMAKKWLPVPIPSFAEAKKMLSVPAQAMPYLQRMQLDQPSNFEEKKLQRAVVYALASAGYI